MGVEVVAVEVFEEDVVVEEVVVVVMVEMVINVKVATMEVMTTEVKEDMVVTVVVVVEEVVMVAMMVTTRKEVVMVVAKTFHNHKVDNMVDNKVDIIKVETLEVNKVDMVHSKEDMGEPHNKVDRVIIKEATVMEALAKMVQVVDTTKVEAMEQLLQHQIMEVLLEIPQLRRMEVVHLQPLHTEELLPQPMGELNNLMVAAVAVLINLNQLVTMQLHRPLVDTPKLLQHMVEQQVHHTDHMDQEVDTMLDNKMVSMI